MRLSFQYMLVYLNIHYPIQLKKLLLEFVVLYIKIYNLTNLLILVESEHQLLCSYTDFIECQIFLKVKISKIIKIITLT